MKKNVKISQNSKQFSILIYPKASVATRGDRGPEIENGGGKRLACIIQ